MIGMTEADVLRLEEQANARIEARYANKNAPGIGMCLVTPHQLLELAGAWRRLHTVTAEPQ